jgi:hypothetical protein
MAADPVQFQIAGECGQTRPSDNLARHTLFVDRGEFVVERL